MDWTIRVRACTATHLAINDLQISDLNYIVGDLPHGYYWTPGTDIPECGPVEWTIEMTDLSPINTNVFTNIDMVSASKTMNV